MTLRHTIISPEKVEETRLLYEADVVPVRECMANIGMKHDAFYTLVHTQGWKLRRPPVHARGDVSRATKARLGVSAEEEKPPVPVTPLTTDEMIPKLEAAIAREFAHADTRSRMASRAMRRKPRKRWRASCAASPNSNA
jgi:hypothetical protein